MTDRSVNTDCCLLCSCFGRCVEPPHLVTQRHEHNHVCSDEYFNSLYVKNVCTAECDRLHSLFSAGEAAEREREGEQRDAPATQLCFLFEEKPQQPVT